MKFNDVRRQLAPLTVFSPQDIALLDPSYRRETLYDWERAGKVVKLRNKHYIFADEELRNVDYYLVSNELYEPSYVSLELALNHYGIIPESVSIFTACTTKKTQEFETPVGTFRYRSLRPALFFGYDLLPVRERQVKIASLEKAVLDMLYFYPNLDDAAAFASARWNATLLRDEIDLKRLHTYERQYDSDALSARLEALLLYIEEHA